MYIKIYKEKKSATQSCASGTKWILETESVFQTQYNSDIKSLRHNNSSTYIKLKFDKYESALAYAQSNNMNVINRDKPFSTKRPKKNYLEDFQR